MVLRHIQLYVLINRLYYQFSFSKRTSPAAADAVIVYSLAGPTYLYAYVYACFFAFRIP